VEIAARGAYLTRDPSARLERDGGWLLANTLSVPLAGCFSGAPTMGL
jgi:hypothetical protein